MEVASADYRGANVDCSAIWSLPLLLEGRNLRETAFCLDAGGLLVHRSIDDGTASTLIPYASKAFVIDHRALRRLESEIRQKTQSSMISSDLRQIYEQGIPKLGDLFAAPVKDEPDYSLVESAIEAHENTDLALQRDLEEELASMGVFKFGAVPNPKPRYFEVVGSGLHANNLVLPGWLTASKVLKKAQLG